LIYGIGNCIFKRKRRVVILRCTKFEGLNLKLSEAMILADEDIKENWKAYQEAFLEGK
jgi:hypothetical protein